MNKRTPRAGSIGIARAGFWLAAVATIYGAGTTSFGTHGGHRIHRIDMTTSEPHLEHKHHTCNGRAPGDLIRNSSFEQTCTEDDWFIENGYLKTAPQGTRPSHFTFGEEGWRDYEVSFQACATKGQGELLIGVRCDSGNSYRLVLGADGNSRHELLRVVNSRRMRREEVTVVQAIKGYIDHGRCHSVRIRCEGKRLQAWLDTRILFDVTDNDGLRSGRVSVGARNGQAQFRNFKVTTLNGGTLFRGLPTPARRWLAVGPGNITLDNGKPLNRNRSIKIVSHGGQTGVEQDCPGLGEGPFRCTLWVRGEASEGLLIRLQDGGETLAKRTLSVPDLDWR